MTSVNTNPQYTLWCILCTCKSINKNMTMINFVIIFWSIVLSAYEHDKGAINPWRYTNSFHSPLRHQWRYDHANIATFYSELPKERHAICVFQSYSSPCEKKKPHLNFSLCWGLHYLLLILNCIPLKPQNLVTRLLPSSMKKQQQNITL